MQEDEIRLLYSNFVFELEFPKEIIVRKFPTFIFRSVLGKELRKNSCILRNEVCETCPVNSVCLYSKIFITPSIEQESIKGNKKPHPFAIYVDLQEGRKTRYCQLHLLLIGESYQYLPYLYNALTKAGEGGIFRERIKFKIKDVLFKGESIKPGEDAIKTLSPFLWQFNSDYENKTRKIQKIHLITPVKIQRNKKLVRNLTYEELIKSGLRRLKLLTLFYGEGADVFINTDLFLSSIEKEERNLIPVSLKYRSFRQKKTISMAGVKGLIEIKKEFSPAELSILKGMEIFGVGKATSFGFGKIRIEE